ncbi:MAG: phage holin family protein [Spirosomataceae bacterium]
MVKYIVKLVLLGILIFFLPNFVDGISIQSFTDAIVVAFLMGVLNTFLKPILQIIALPITFMTLGLFYFVINIILVYICSYFVDGFAVVGVIPPLVFSFVISLSNWFIGLFLD